MKKSGSGSLSFTDFDEQSSSNVDKSLDFAGLSGSSTSKNIIDLPISDIRPNPDQPRKIFDEKKLRELAESMKERSLLSPILIRNDTQGYIITAGERRYQAALLLGWKTIPCILKNENEDDSYINSLVENLQREDLTVYEEAEGYMRLKTIYGKTQEETAALVGKDRTTISKVMKILTMPEKPYAMAKFSNVDKAKVLMVLDLPDEQSMIDALAQIIDNQANTQLSAQIIEKHAKKTKPGRPRDTATLKLGKSTKKFIRTADTYFKKQCALASTQEKHDLVDTLVIFQAKLATYIENLRNEIRLEGNTDII